MDLAGFLAPLVPLAWQEVTWGGGTFPLRVSCYRCEELPPDPLITSVRALIYRSGEVLVMVDREGAPHLLPGGRREPGEAMEQTLRRELLEETGWCVGEPRLLGLLHYRHLAPRSDGYRYPHPEFIQLVYSAPALERVPGARDGLEFAEEPRFVALEDARRLALPAVQRSVLELVFGG